MVSNLKNDSDSDYSGKLSTKSAGGFSSALTMSQKLSAYMNESLKKPDDDSETNPYSWYKTALTKGSLKSP